MGITAAELIGLVRIEGADTGTAQILGVGRAFDTAGGGPLSTFQRGLGNLVFGFRNLSTAGTIGTDAIKQSAVQMGTALWQVAGIATLVGGAIAVGIGVISVRAAADFQQGLNRLVTGAGDVTDNMAKMGQSILGVSTTTGVMTGPLLSAMYQIISASQRGAQAENTLAVAAKGSVTEQANIVDVAKALTTAMTDYGTKTFNATQFMNGYTRATQLGKITLEELSKSMGPILPLAQNLGIKFADVAGAMSTMTNAGMPAERAATSLRFLFQSLENPTHKASVAMKDFGLDSVKLGNELKVSLPGALQMVYEAAKKAGPEGSVPFNRAVSDMIGGQRSLQAYLALTGTHLATFKGNTQAISGAMNASKTGVLGWATAQSNFNVQMDRGKAVLNVLAITIGQQLLPGLTKMMGVIVPLIAQFTSWLVSSGALQNTITILGGAFNILGTIVGGVVHFFQQNEVAMAALKATLIVAAAVIGVMMAMAFYSMAAAAWVAAAGVIAATWPLILIGAVVVAVVAGIILAVQHWGAIMTWIGNVMSAVGTFVHGVLSAIGAWFGSIFSAIGTTVHNALNAVAVFAITKFNDILNFVKSIPGKIGQALSTLGAILVAPFLWLYNHNYYVKAFVDSAINIFNQLKAQVGATFSALGTLIRDKLTETKNFFGNIFFLIGTIVRDKLTDIKNTVGSVFSIIGSFIHEKLTVAKNDVGNIFSQIGSSVSQKLNDLRNLVGNAFSLLGSMMHDKLVAAWNGLVSFANGWPSQAFNWGVNLVKGIINGIGSMFSALGAKVHELAGQFGKFLGFHASVFGVPAEGPAHEADTWMPALLKGLTGQLTAGQGKMKAALAGLMTPLATSMHVSATGSLSGITGASGGAFSPGAPRYSFPLSGGQPTIVVNVQSPDVNLDGWRVTDRLMPHITSKIRYNIPGGMGR